MEDTNQENERRYQDYVKIVTHLMSSGMSSLSPNYIAATFLEFLHLFINLVCAVDMSFFPKL